MVSEFLPQYWRFTVWGTGGVIEFNCTENKITAWIQGQSEPEIIIPAAYTGPKYLDWYLMELDGKPGDLNTNTVLKRTRQALEIQQQADHFSL